MITKAQHSDDQNPNGVAISPTKLGEVSDHSDELRDNGYFTYRVTGDEQLDVKLYGEAKAAFVAKFPERYAQMVKNTSPVGKIKISAEELEAMPTEKKKAILSSPSLYEVIK